jgi:hypothetical protein
MYGDEMLGEGLFGNGAHLPNPTPEDVSRMRLTRSAGTFVLVTGRIFPCSVAGFTLIRFPAILPANARCDQRQLPRIEIFQEESGKPYPGTFSYKRLYHGLRHNTIGDRKPIRPPHE